MPIPDPGDGATDEATVNGLSSARARHNADSLADGPCASFGDRPGRLGVLLVGHGSRRASGNEEFERLVRAFERRHPEPLTAFGYVELARPSLADALDELASRVNEVVVVPAFLFLAGHVKNDMPLAVARAREAHPGVRFVIARPLGVDARLCVLAWARAEAALGEGLPTDEPTERTRTACLFVGRGSSDPDANGDFFKVSRLLSEYRALVRVEPCFLGITQPDVEAGLDLLARLRPTRVVVLPYILFCGRLLERLRGSVAEFGRRHQWIATVIAGHLDADPVVLDLLAKRALQALDHAMPLPCDTCQYRVPLPGRALQAGGLRALLWSMRHTYTHSQAMPAEHAHPPVDKHVFVCTNVDCADRGSVPLLRRLRAEVKAEGLVRRVRVTRTACMGRCGEGPSVAVYPDGIWYRHVTAADVPEIVAEHLKSDRLVARLVDNILQ